MSKILFLCILFKKVVKKSHHQSPSSNIQVVPPPPHSASHIHYPHPLSIHIHPLSIFRWYPCPHTQYHTSTTLEHPLSTVNVHPLSMFIHYPSIIIHYPYSGGASTPSLRIPHPLSWNRARPSATYGYQCPCYVEVKYNSRCWPIILRH